MPKNGKNDSRNSQVSTFAAGLGLGLFPNRLKLVNFIYIYIVYLSGPEVPLPPWLWDLSGKFSEFRVFRLA